MWQLNVPTIVIPAKAGIQENIWIPPARNMPGQANQVRHDVVGIYHCRGNKLYTLETHMGTEDD